MTSQNLSTLLPPKLFPILFCAPLSYPSPTTLGLLFTVDIFDPIINVDSLCYLSFDQILYLIYLNFTGCKEKRTFFLSELLLILVLSVTSSVLVLSCQEVLGSVTVILLFIVELGVYIRS